MLTVMVSQLKLMEEMHYQRVNPIWVESIVSARKVMYVFQSTGQNQPIWFLELAIPKSTENS